MLFTIPFAENKRRGLELNHYLTVYYCDWDENINKSVQAAVQACLGMTTPNNMVGNYVVMSGQHGSYTGTPGHEFGDMTLADFRHALDWFSTCFDDTVRETPCGGSVRAVKVSCPLEQTIYGRDLFTSVAVDRDFPSTSEVSPISQALGLPIRVCQLEQDYLKQAIKLGDEASGEEEEERWTNPYAQALMTDIDLESENWGKTRQHWDIDGSFLLIRADREDMDFALAKHMSCYCFDVLKPLFERTLSGEISRQDVLEEITFDKAMAWKLVDASTGVAAEPRPQRGFVRRIGSQSWEDARQHFHVLNVAD